MEYLEVEWVVDYEGIYWVNIVLECVLVIEMDMDLKNWVLGEVKFIWVWFFYNLVMLFGDVFLVDWVLVLSEYNLLRMLVVEVWVLIE